MTMKFFILPLAIVFFAGCQAYVLRDEPYPHLSRLNEELQEYLRNITRVVEEKAEVIRRSELGQSVIDKLFNTYSKVSRHWRNLEAKLPAEVAQGYDLVVGIPMGVVGKGLNTIRALYRKVTPVTDEYAEALYNIVAPYADSVLEKVERHTKALRHSLIAKAEEMNPKLNDKLKQQLEELKTQLTPYIKSLESQLQELRASLQPFIDHVEEKFKEGAEMVNQLLQPYTGPILRSIKEYTKDFKDWVDTPLVPPSP